VVELIVFIIARFSAALYHFC